MNKPGTWEEYSNRFINHLRFERGLSDETIRAYASDLRQLQEYYFSRTGNEDLKLSDISADFIRGFLASMHKRLEKTSQARKLSTLRTFFRYLDDYDLFDENPADRVASPKTKAKIPSFLDVDDVFHFLDALQKAATVAGCSWRRVRNWALFECLYSTGIRVGELVNLDEPHVAFDSGMVKVTGKGSKERVVPIGKKALVSIREYLNALNLQFPEGRAQKQKCQGGQTHCPLGTEDPADGVEKMRAMAASQPTCVAPHIRNPSFECRRGLACDPGNAWAFQSFHHTALYTCSHESTDENV